MNIDPSISLGAQIITPLVQVFFHDLDYNMIEICNCDNLPIELLSEKCQLSRACTAPLEALQACKAGINAGMHFDKSRVHMLRHLQ